MHRLLPLGLGGLAMLSACGSNNPRIVAKIERIERSCQYDETEFEDHGAGERKFVSRTVRKYDCSDDPKFLAVKTGRDKNFRAIGHATAIIRYTSPVDQKQHQAWIRIDASRREFYTLEAGQEVRVRIDPKNSSQAYL
jgi:hypothetical protein